MSVDEGDEPRRRASDRVPAAVQLFVEQEVGKTRHILREEMQVLVQGLTNQVTDLRQFMAREMTSQARDHATVIARLDRLTDSLVQINTLRDEVEELKVSDSVNRATRAAEGELLHRLDQNRKWVIGAAGALAGLILTCISLVLTHT